MAISRPLPTLLSRRALLALTVLACPSAQSSAIDLKVLTAPDPAAQRPLLQALKARYPGLLADADPAILQARGPGGLVVTLGPAALRRALQVEPRLPIVSLLTASPTWRQLTTAAPARELSTLTCLYADASPLAQLQLIFALFERRVTVGVLLSDESSFMERRLRQAAGTTGLDVLIERAEPGEVVRALNRLSGAHVLLAVPDSMLYTPDSLRAVLESTYRRSLPVVGFSAATVAAGTLASAYCAAHDVAADLALLLDELPASGSWPEPRHPQHWRVAVNEHVARSLGIPITGKVLALGNPASGRVR